MASAVRFCAFQINPELPVIQSFANRIDTNGWRGYYKFKTKYAHIARGKENR